MSSDLLIRILDDWPIKRTQIQGTKILWGLISYGVSLWTGEPYSLPVFKTSSLEALRRSEAQRAALAPLWMSGQDDWSGLTLTDEVCSLSFLQLFRRVAAALPGMESTQDKSREDSILILHRHTCVYDYACFSVAIDINAYRLYSNM